LERLRQFVVADFNNGAILAQISCRFTDWSMPSQTAPHLDNYFKPQTGAFSDCQFRGGKLLVYNAAIHFTNDLFERVYVSWTIPASRRHLAHRAKLPLRQRRLIINRWNSDVWLFRDNMFDHVAINPGRRCDNAFDGYNHWFRRLTPNNTNDVVASLTS